MGDFLMMVLGLGISLMTVFVFEVCGYVLGVDELSSEFLLLELGLIEHG